MNDRQAGAALAVAIRRVPAARLAAAPGAYGARWCHYRLAFFRTRALQMLSLTRERGQDSSRQNSDNAEAARLASRRTPEKDGPTSSTGHALGLIRHSARQLKMLQDTCRMPQRTADDLPIAAPRSLRLLLIAGRHLPGIIGHFDRQSSATQH